jgi:hypothetical protein
VDAFREEVAAPDLLTVAVCPAATTAVQAG